MVPCGDPVSLAPWMETYDVVDAETADIWNKGQLHAVNANGILLKCWRGRWTGLSEWINTVYEKCNETESAQAN